MKIKTKVLAILMINILVTGCSGHTNTMGSLPEPSKKEKYNPNQNYKPKWVIEEERKELDKEKSGK